MKTMQTMYNVSWTPWRGEATFKNTFRTEEDRARFIDRIKARSVHTWETEYSVTLINN